MAPAVELVEPVLIRFGHGSRTCPRPDVHISSAPYPSRTSRPSTLYARSPPPTSTTTARWSPNAISTCSPDGDSGKGAKSRRSTSSRARPRVARHGSRAVPSRARLRGRSTRSSTRCPCARATASRSVRAHVCSSRIMTAVVFGSSTCVTRKMSSSSKMCPSASSAAPAIAPRSTPAGPAASNPASAPKYEPSAVASSKSRSLAVATIVVPLRVLAHDQHVDHADGPVALQPVELGQDLAREAVAREREREHLNRADVLHCFLIVDRTSLHPWRHPGRSSCWELPIERNLRLCHVRPRGTLR